MFWLDKYHIDGLRIGALSSMLYLDYGKTEGEWEPNKFGGKENLDAVDFVKRLNTAVHMYHPDVMMFAEENTSWPKLTHKNRGRRSWFRLQVEHGLDERYAALYVTQFDVAAVQS